MLVAPSGKIKTMLGWTPKYNLSTIKETVWNLNRWK